jgi:hypothetical protein
LNLTLSQSGEARVSSNRAAPARAVVLNGDGVPAQRTAAFLKLLGIEREEITPETLIGQASSETGSPYKGGSPLVLSGEDIGLLSQITARQGVSLDRVIAPFSTIILHSVHPRRIDSRAIEDVLSATRLSFVEFGSDSKNYSVCRNNSVCGPLSGLAFGPIDRTVDCGLNVLSCDGHVEKLIEIDGAGLLTKIQRGSQTVLVSTASEVMDLDETTNDKIDFRTCFSRIVPLLLALRSAFGDRCWRPQHYRANIIIDDPPLWPRYGHLDLRKLAETTDRLRCACTIAMIPWNYRRSKQDIANVFASRAPRLGICFHGCNHTEAEFGVRDDARLMHIAGTARRRMNAHEQITGLACQPVMVFPQGVFSVEAMRHLRSAGYLAAINTEIQDYHNQVSVTRAELMQPALLCYGGLPVFSRRKPEDGIVNFAVDAFLGKPCLVVLHHEFFKTGFSAFEELVQGISSLHPRLAWTNLQNIVKETDLSQVDSRAQGVVKKFTNRIRINGESPDDAAIPAAQPFRESLTERLRIAARRYACEFRDNYLGRLKSRFEGVEARRYDARNQESEPQSRTKQEEIGKTEISVRGQIHQVPSILVDGRNVIATGKWIKVAAVQDEAFQLGEVVARPEMFITKLKQWAVRPDIFQFAQKFTDPKPRFSYLMEWDNFAAVPITSYEEWLQKHAKKDVKENLRRAKREGVVVKTCEYNDEFAQGIKSLYDETPVRQGQQFWHHNKPLEKVKKENGTYLERSEYIGAFLENELIGFIKMVYVDEYAKTMQVLTKDRFFYKRPANALIAKAIEVCASKGIKYFNYGFYEYRGKKENSLTNFKTRHGLLLFSFPRYYISLTLKGRIYLTLGLHRGLKRLIPRQAVNVSLKVRSAIHYAHLLAQTRQPGRKL